MTFEWQIRDIFIMMTIRKVTITMDLVDFFFFTVEEMKPEILMHWNLAFTLSFREWIQSREATPSRGSWNLFKVAGVDMRVCMCVLSHSVMSLCNCSPPGSSIHGILQARILEPFPSPGDLPEPGIEPTSLALTDGFLTTEPPGKPCWRARDPYFQATWSLRCFQSWKTPRTQQC